MEFMLDTANLNAIKRYNEALVITGVTSNPSIIKKEGTIDFYTHMRAIREIIGRDKSLHIQVVAQDYEGILADAQAILEHVDSEVYIKVPVTEIGLRAIKTLKVRGVHVTATAVYSKFQAYLALAAGADFIAPYYNRMENLNIDSAEVIREIAAAIERSHSQTKILAASFKNVAQVNQAFENGAQTATMGADIIAAALGMPSIQKAVDDFKSDWESSFGAGTTPSKL
ncbi:MAG: fructose-6-phosphate aldolase [Streptococcaceae bacterium]|jgi:TalC/MipB family fructose-6-phosphate aldolase|nr:fructose-6-phosphate aldolase [Streptococcaceae bacterium]